MSDSINSLHSKTSMHINGNEFHYFSLLSPELQALGDVSRLPYCLKVLVENLLRHENNDTCTKEDIAALINSAGKGKEQEITYFPARVLMQDFTGVPGVVDLAAMRDALAVKGIDPEKINPLTPVDLVIDHSVSIDHFATEDAYEENMKMEIHRNQERYEFLKWGQRSFNQFRVVPPGMGICHQVNLEYLGQVVWNNQNGDENLLYPDTLVGTDSHTPMINSLGILGWGVGGIEAEAAMLGQPVSMLIPEVIGFELKGKLNEGITATDLVLVVVEQLREFGVVGKFVEFFGEGLDDLSVSDRATIANMSPENGSTCGFFPVDKQTLTYLELSGRSKEQIEIVETYCKAQGLWRESGEPSPYFATALSLDLSTVEASVAGPKRPQDRVTLPNLKQASESLIELNGKGGQLDTIFEGEGGVSLSHGDVVIAAITSCTNTSNPAVMLGAGLVAKKAIEKGLTCKEWIKTSLAPGSKVVTDYLQAAGLQSYLDQLGFNLVGYGCTTCIGNSGPLPDAVAHLVKEHDLIVNGVLSGNRNYEGRIHPLTQGNWLASPPLVVAYALAGTTRIDLHKDPLGCNAEGEAIYLKDIWPSNQEIAELVQKVNNQMFTKEYGAIFDGNDSWQQIKSSQSKTYSFSGDSTYIQKPPFFTEQKSVGNIKGAAILALLGDSVTTDHISPAGAIPLDSPAAQYLRRNGVADADFNSYGSRRGNHEVMMRGTFGNIRIRNEMTPQIEGGYTRLIGESEPRFIFDAAMEYIQRKQDTVVIAGKEYGTGSSRDWAAKGTLLLGAKAVIAESYERIHRSNLIGMGILPLQFLAGETRKTLALTGDELIDINDIETLNKSQSHLSATVRYPNGEEKSIALLCRIDTEMELAYFKAGGVLHYVLQQIEKESN